MEKTRDSFFLHNKKHNKQDKKQENFKERKEDYKKQPFKHQEKFDENRKGLENVKEKKPFDKNLYRMKKYSKKYKLDQWEEQRKKKLIRDFQKEMKNDPMAGSYKPVSFDEDVTDSNQAGRYVRHPDLIENDASNMEEKNKKDPFRKAKEQYNKVKQDKLQKQQKIQKAKEAREEKLKQYKKKKQDRFKKLSMKTKKGQPMMKGRLELLLDKIQKDS